MSGTVIIDAEQFLADTDDLAVGVQALYLLFILRAHGEADPIVDNDQLAARRMGLTVAHWQALRRKLAHLISTAPDGRLRPAHGMLEGV